MTTTPRRPRRLATAALAGLVLAGLTLTGCGSDDGQSTKVDSSKTDETLRAMLPDDVLDKGELQVASDVPYPPYEFYDKDGKTIIGFEPDLAKELGDLLGLRLTFHVATYDTMIPAMASGKYDVAFTGMSDTPDRQKKLTFVDYMTTGGSFMVKSDAEKKPDGLEGLCGLEVGAQSGTYIVDFLQGQVAPACPASAKLKLDQFTGQDDLVNALRSERVDVAVIPSPSAGYLVQTTGDEFELPFTLDVGLVGIAFPRDDAQVAEAFQAALQKLMDDGTYAELLDRYGLGKMALDKATIDAGTV